VQRCWTATGALDCFVGQLIVSVWLSVANREHISVKYDLSEVFALRCEGPNLIVEEFNPCIDVAIRHLGDFRQWQTVAEHLEDKTVLVTALVVASGLAFGEGRSTEAALPTRITTSGLAEFPIELRMFMRRTALRETARSLAPRLRWIGLLQNLVSAAFCDNLCVVLQPSGR
jgi:hypothetical protein